MTPLQTLAWKLYCDVPDVGSWVRVSAWDDLTSTQQLFWLEHAELKMLDPVGDSDDVIVSRSLVNDLIKKVQNGGYYGQPWGMRTEFKATEKLKQRMFEGKLKIDQAIELNGICFYVNGPTNIDKLGLLRDGEELMTFAVQKSLSKGETLTLYGDFKILVPFKVDI